MEHREALELHVHRVDRRTDRRTQDPRRKEDVVASLRESATWATKINACDRVAVLLLTCDATVADVAEILRGAGYAIPSHGVPR